MYFAPNVGTPQRGVKEAHWAMADPQRPNALAPFGAPKGERPKSAEQPTQPGFLGAGDAHQVEDRIGGKLTGWLQLRTDQIEQKVDLTMAKHDAKIDGIEKQLLAKLNATDAKLDGKPGH